MLQSYRVTVQPWSLAKSITDNKALVLVEKKPELRPRTVVMQGQVSFIYLGPRPVPTSNMKWWSQAFNCIFSLMSWTHE